MKNKDLRLLNEESETTIRKELVLSIVWTMVCLAGVIAVLIFSK